MQFGTGGSSGYQSGTTSGSTNTSGTVNQTGTSNVNQTGSSTGTSTGTTTGTTTATPTDLWGQLSTLLGTNVGGTGLTTGQTGALTNLQSYVNGPNSASTRINATLPQFQSIADAPATTIAEVPKVQGRSASEFMGQYYDPALGMMVNSTKADMDQAFKESQNELRARYGGAGWSPTAGSPSGLQLTATEGADKYLRSLGTTLGGLRRDAFTTALSGGASDASRAQAADTTNVSNQLAINTGNAGLQEQAYGRGTDALSRIMGGTTTAQNAATTGQQQVYGMSGGGLNQIIAALNSQVPAFGGSTTGATTGSTTGATTGATTGQTTNQSVSDMIANVIGSSSGYSRGNQSGASVGGK